MAAWRQNAGMTSLIIEVWGSFLGSNPNALAKIVTPHFGG